MQTLKKWRLWCLVLFFAFAKAYAQEITDAEYFFDNDPGVGNGTTLTVSSNTGTLTDSFTIPITGLSSGFHRVYIRVRENLGTWSHYDSASFYINTLDNNSSGGTPIVAAEYFYDSDPGVGSGTAITVPTSGAMIDESFALPITGLAGGFHRVYIRVQDDVGVWSHYDSASFYVNDLDNNSSGGAPIVAAEFFFNDDPGVGSGTAIALTGPGTEVIETFSIPLATGMTGFNRVYIRVQDDVGTWSHYDSASFYVNDLDNNTGTATEIVAAEYYFDTDPGFGMATAATLTPTGDENGFMLDIDASSVTCGVETVLYIRVQDDAGTWSLYDVITDLGNEDTIGPDIMANTAITLDLDTTGMATLDINDVENGTTDNCSGVDSLVLSQTAFTCVDLGVNEVIFTATDAQGNTSTETITVTVQDMIVPSLTADAITMVLDANGMATLDPDSLVTSLTDNCIDGLIVTASQVSFSCDDQGPNDIVLTATDASGNTSTQTVTVTVTDESAPTALTQNITVSLDTAGIATITAAQVDNGSSDNCTIASLTIDIDSFDCSNLGANTVTLTAEDQNGLSSTATATVTIVDDLAPTIADCPAADVVEEVATGTAFEVPDYTTTFTVTDNCSGSTLSQTPPAGTLVQIGSSTNVTITATDAAGNEAICSFNVIVDELLGIDESVWSQSVTLYPVPAQEVLNIDSLRAIDTVTIIDVLGRVVDTHTMNGATRINVANLAEGSYFIQITSENETVTKRILKSSK